MCQPEPHWLSKQRVFRACGWHIWIIKAMFFKQISSLWGFWAPWVYRSRLVSDIFYPCLCGNSVYSTFFRSTESRLWDCRVVSVEVVTHNCKLFCCELPDGVIMRVPIGHHIHLHRDVEGKENYWSLYFHDIVGCHCRSWYQVYPR